MIVKTENGQYVELSSANVVTVPYSGFTKEERKELYRIQTEKHKQKLAEEKERKSVPNNNYNIQTIKRIYKGLGYELKPIYGGYKGGRFQPRQKYDVIENFGDHRVIVESQNYYQLGEILRRIGAL